MLWCLAWPPFIHHFLSPFRVLTFSYISTLPWKGFFWSYSYFSKMDSQGYLCLLKGGERVWNSDLRPYSNIVFIELRIIIYAPTTWYSTYLQAYKVYDGLFWSVSRTVAHQGICSRTVSTDVVFVEDWWSCQAFQGLLTLLWYLCSVCWMDFHVLLLLSLFCL